MPRPVPRAPRDDHRLRPQRAGPRGRQQLRVRQPLAAQGDRPHGRPARGGRLRRHDATRCLPARLRPGSKVAAAYGEPIVYERHRHRYEFNNRYRAPMEDAGLLSSGTSPDDRLVEFLELAGHPFWVGTQATPSSRAGPTAPIRCSGSSSAPRWPGPRGGRPACSISSAFERDRSAAPQRGGAPFRKLGEELVHRGSLISGGAGHLRGSRWRGVRARCRAPSRRGVRGARHRRGHGRAAGAPVPRRGRPRAARDPRGQARRRR